MKKLLLLVSAAALAASFVGCSSVTYQGKTKTNLLGGAFINEEAAFKPKNPVGFTLSRSTFSASRTGTGNQTSVLWGLFTYNDY